ncbi:MAG: von Willebrand factor type A domain-containing protein [Planctomycetota bacterium]
MSAPETDFQEDRLTAYALDELSAEERADVERQLAGSAELQQELTELQSLVSDLRTELSAEAMPRLTEVQHRQIQTEVGVLTTVISEPVPLKTQNSTRRRSIRRWAILSAEIACGFAFVGAVTSFAWRGTLLSERMALDTASAKSGLGVPDNHPETYFANEASRVTGPRTADANFGTDNYTKNFMSEPEVFNVEAEVDQPDSVKQPGFIVRSSLHNTDVSDNLNRMDLQPNVEFNKELKSMASPDRVVASRKPKPHQVTEKARFNLVREQQFRYIPPESESRRSESADLQSGETYQATPENLFLTPAEQPLSTFSIDVDTASYANLRRFLTQGQLPPANAVRIEEMINAFTYDYPRPKEGEPFSVTADAAPCLWQRGHYLARIALQARTFDKSKRPPTNLVFLLDVSGSMQAANKLPLVKQAMTMLAEELNERDRIAIVTYAGDAGVKLASTPGHDQTRIMQAIEALQAGGSTNGAAGINLAYEEAIRHFNGEGENRVILCTDGDFNVGISDDDQLVKLITEQAKTKVFLSVFGFGMGNLKDAKLEKLADKGNGHYGYIDDMREARRVFNEELVGTLYTVAKDVKIQVEFNPLTVGAYRLIGYENRALAARDFNDDTKDAGEIGAGHTVTALYEIVPRGQWPKTPGVDPLKYTATKAPVPAPVAPPNNIPPEAADDLFTVKLRYKLPTADTSVKTVDYVVDDIAGKNIAPSTDAKWAAAVAAFGMHLKQSQFKGTWTLDDIYEAALSAKGADTNRRRQEFLDLIQSTKLLSSK